MLLRVAGCGAALVALALSPLAQQPPASIQVPVTVVSAGKKANVRLGDIVVRQNDTVVPATGWTPDRRPVELFLAIDEDSAVDLSRRLDDVRNFIRSLPDSVAVGLAYLSLNGAEVVAAPTADHATVAKEVRPPKGQPGLSPSPFDSIAALLAEWPVKPGSRRELVVFSDGSQYTGGENNPTNPVLLKTIALTQQAGVVAFTVAVRGAGDATGVAEGGNQAGLRVQNGGLAKPEITTTASNKPPATNPRASVSKNYNASSGSPQSGAPGSGSKNTMNSPASKPGMEVLMGQGNLRAFAEQTGGIATIQADQIQYIDNFLTNVANRLQQQYLLTFTPLPGSTGPVSLRVDSKLENVSLRAPAIAFVP